MKHEGKIALVTGGTRGIGKAISLRLAEDGADIILNYKKDSATAEETAAEIQALVNDPTSIAIIGEDADGDIYRFYPLDSSRVKLFRHGDLRTTLRTYGAMMPVDANAGFPHFFGVHAYFTTTADEPVLGLDVRISNGGEDFDGTWTPEIEDDNYGPIHFKYLRLCIAEDLGEQYHMLQRFEDVYSYRFPNMATGSTALEGRNYAYFPLVEEDAAGLHELRSLEQFHRRLAISPRAQFLSARRFLDSEGQAFCRNGVRVQGGSEELWSWFNPETARYGPIGLTLPTLNFTNGAYGGMSDMRAELESWSNGLIQAVSAGTALPFSEGYGETGNGWANPLGQANGGAAGPASVVYLEGVRTAATSSLAGLDRLVLRHRMLMDRQRNHVFHVSGEPLKLEHWDDADESLGQTPTMRLATVSSSQNMDGSDFFVEDLGVGFPSGSVLDYYIPDSGGDKVIADYQMVDNKHLTRVAQTIMAVTYLTNDPVARDDLQMLGERAQISISSLQVNEPNVFCSTEGGWLRNAMNVAINHPNSGANIGRGEGWGLQATCGAYATGSDDFRERALPWFDTWTQLVQDCQLTGLDDNGVMIGSLYAAYIRNYIPNVGLLPDEPIIQQMWEDMLVTMGLHCMVNTVYGEASSSGIALTGVLDLSHKGYVAPIAWDPVYQGPWGYRILLPHWDMAPNCVQLATPDPIMPYRSHFGVPVAFPYTDSDAHVSAHYVGTALAIAYSQSGDPTYRDKMLDFYNARVGGSYTDLLTAFQAEMDPTKISDYDGWLNVCLFLGMMQN